MFHFNRNSSTGNTISEEKFFVTKLSKFRVKSNEFKIHRKKKLFKETFEKCIIIFNVITPAGIEWLCEKKTGTLY